MINSMTVEERHNRLLASSPGRRRRIASGAGYKEADGKLVSDFQKMRSLMQQMGQGSFRYARNVWWNG